MRTLRHREVKQVLQLWFSLDGSGSRVHGPDLDPVLYPGYYGSIYAFIFADSLTCCVIPLSWILMFCGPSLMGWFFFSFGLIKQFRNGSLQNKGRKIKQKEIRKLVIAPLECSESSLTSSPEKDDGRQRRTESGMGSQQQGKTGSNWFVQIPTRHF